MPTYEQELAIVKEYLPSDTRYVQDSEGRNIWIFTKNTELDIPFEIAIYHNPSEGGYSAQLISPQLEDTWRDQHVGHLFYDGIICMGRESPGMRARYKLTECYAKACLWAEGMAIMIQSNLLGMPCEFPFSDNNDPSEAGALRN